MTPPPPVPRHAWALLVVLGGCGAPPAAPDGPPWIALEWPAAGAVAPPGSGLVAAAGDDRDSPEALAVGVESDLDGWVAEGHPAADGSFVVEPGRLRCGWHTLTLSAEDGAGGRSEDVAAIGVAPEPPLAEIEEPAPGALVDLYTPLRVLTWIAAPAGAMEVRVDLAFEEGGGDPSALGAAVLAAAPDPVAVEWAVAGLPPGLVHLDVTATADCAGATASATTRVTVLVAGLDLDGDGEIAADLPGGTDCDDQDPTVGAGMPEECDGVDDDCDGIPDDGFDLDGDGSPAAAGGCGGIEEDCDDGSAEVRPGAAELCNGVDDDCDGATDEDHDLDGDGWPAGASCHGGAVAVDCDDADPGAHPDAPESCDGRDEDSDGTADEDYDQDGDGRFDEGACAGVLEDLDCDDTEPLAWTGAEERCGDGVVNDCSPGPDGVPVFPVHCRLGGTVSLASAALALSGEGAGDGAGSAVALVDLDGDGLSDLVVSSPSPEGAPDVVDGGWGRGAAWWVSASSAAEAWAEGLATFDLGLADGRVAGDEDGDGLGASLAVGSLGGDPHLLVGAPGVGGAGAVLAFSAWEGSAAAADLGPESWYGTSDGLSAGFAVDWVGGGGGAYLAIGAPGSSAGGEEGGAVFVAPMSSPGPLDAETVTLYGSLGDRAGTALSAGGDLDGDGVFDLAVGAPGHGADGDAEGAGAVYVVLDAASLSIANLADAGIRLTLPDGAPGDGLGSALATCDIDGDGIDDLLSAAPGRDGADPDLAPDLGVVLAWSGADIGGEAVAIVTGTFPQERLGAALACPGDLDGDGRDDLLIGAPGSDLAGDRHGAVLVFYGPLAGDLPSAAASAAIMGTHQDDGVGASVAGGGDLDGDGVPDLLVGAPGADPGGAASGAAYLVLGGGA